MTAMLLHSQTLALEEHRLAESDRQPAFIEILAALHHKVEQQAEQAEAAVRTQELREEDERFLQAGSRQQAAKKLEDATARMKDAQLESAAISFPKLHIGLEAIVQEPGWSSIEPRAHSAGPLTQLDIEHGHIRRFLEYFQGPGKASFQRTRARLERYREMMERIFEEEGVPKELIVLAQIESGSNPLALSPANARGLWQFIPQTALRYGLLQTGLIDDRIDPLKSTRAAARYLRDLFAQFGDWPLALAAYNAGENRIAALISKTGIRNFWTLSRMGVLPSETVSHVPAVLASVVLHRSNEK